MKWPVASGKWRVETRLLLRRALSIVALSVGLLASPAATTFAQDQPAPKDDALENLLEKVSGSTDRGEPKADKPTSAQKEGSDRKKTEQAAKTKTSGPDAKKDGKGQGAQDGKAPAKKAEGSGALSGKDQEVDELLQKLGETAETPSPDDRPRGGAGRGEKAEGQGPSQPGEKNDRNRLSGKDKETDEHLEELTGRRRRKKDDNEERSGPAGQIIKEMRDIEQKLQKPDTGEATREEQKKVVKHIETLIEQVRQSGQSGMGRMMVRRGRRPGQQPGQQPGSTEGAMARGAPPMKPMRPTTKHSPAGGKDIWGHLPDELRQEIENMINELPLATKEALIERYYLSVAKGKPVREETP
jgi:hypothetical protein